MIVYGRMVASPIQLDIGEIKVVIWKIATIKEKNLCVLLCMFENRGCRQIGFVVIIVLNRLCNDDITCGNDLQEGRFIVVR